MKVMIGKSRFLFAYGCVSSIALLLLGLWSAYQIAKYNRLKNVTAHSLSCFEAMLSIREDGNSFGKITEICRDGSDQIALWSLSNVNDLNGVREETLAASLVFFQRRVLRQPNTTTLKSEEIARLREMLEE